MSQNELILDDSTSNDVLFPKQFGRGLVERDLKAYPPGHYMFAPPADIKLIARSEWSARIKEMEETKSRLSDIRMTGNNGQMIPSLNQGQYGYCATADTEVLTENGWVMYPDYDWTTPVGTVNQMTHALEFQRPFEKHVYEYDGEMFYSTNRSLDFGVTPDHQMYVRKWDENKRTLSNQYSFVKMKDLGWYAGFMPSPSGQIGTEIVELEVPGDRRYDGDDFFAMLGLIVSDGYAGGTDNTKNWVSFASFREETREAVAALASRCGFHECPSRKGVWIRYDAGALANWLRENCYVNSVTGALSKKVPGLIKVASMRQIKLFLHWFDDRSRDGVQFYSASRQLIDDLQELHLRIGKRATIGKVPAKEAQLNGKTIRSKDAFVLTVRQADKLSIDRKQHIETDRYKGLVYCAAVPNHTLITRRNGSVLISSNCWAHSSTSCVMMLRAMDNQPYIPLSAFAVAATIKNGRNEGGWGAQSLDFIVSRGIPDQKYWPQGSANLSHGNTECWNNAALHKVTEDWQDLTKAQYDRELTFDQVMTLLLSRIPVVGDFNWWAHSVALLDPVEIEPGSFGVRIWNSWGDEYSNKGMAVLRGNQAIPDGAVAPRATKVSPV